MKTEEVKYVYQPDGPMLVPKTKNCPVYQETTISNKKSSCWTSHLFSRLRLVISCLAIVACLVVIAVSDRLSSQYCEAAYVILWRRLLNIDFFKVLMTNGIKASNNRELAQEEEIAMLKDLVENQQSKMHRMQKELQFLVTRQKVHLVVFIAIKTLYIYIFKKAYEAREESFRRRQLPIVSSPSAGTGTGSSVWPSSIDKSVPESTYDVE